MRATSQIMSISLFSQIPCMKGTLPNQCIFPPVYVIILLNIISVLQPTAARFKGSLVSRPRAPNHIHTATSLSSLLPFFLTLSCSLVLSHSLRHSPAVPVSPRADWSQEGATFLNSGEDWVTQSQHQPLCVTQLCCFFFFPFPIADRYDSNGILMAYSANPVSLSPSICLWICLLPDNAPWVSFWHLLSRFMPGMLVVRLQNVRERSLWFVSEILLCCLSFWPIKMASIPAEYANSS